MKKLSETLKELGIDFTFPIEIKDSNGNKTYYEDIGNRWYKREYDANGNQTYYENNSGYRWKREYDSDGNETYFEDSDGRIEGTPRSQSFKDKWNRSRW